MGLGSTSKLLGNTLQFAQTHAPPHTVDGHRYSSSAEAAVAPAARSLVADRSGARVAGFGGGPMACFASTARIRSTGLHEAACFGGDCSSSCFYVRNSRKYEPPDFAGAKRS